MFAPELSPYLSPPAVHQFEEEKKKRGGERGEEEREREEAWGGFSGERPSFSTLSQLKVGDVLVGMIVGDEEEGEEEEEERVVGIEMMERQEGEGGVKTFCLTTTTRSFMVGKERERGMENEEVGVVGVLVHNMNVKVKFLTGEELEIKGVNPKTSISALKVKCCDAWG